MSTRNVYLFVFDTLADWEAPYAIAGINSPEGQRQPGTFQVRTVATGPGLVTTAGGVRIQPDLTLGELNVGAGEMLILPGGTTWDEGKNMEAVETAKTVLASGGAVAAICGATAGLARGGILDNRQHTSNAREYLEATQYKGGALYQDEAAVTDGAVITASGTAPIEFAYNIFRHLDLYPDDVLEAWYGLFKTGKPEFFAALQKAQA
ncbi:MAG: DJ-1/PfpI family protein [Pseudomonadota bacterium]